MSCYFYIGEISFSPPQQAWCMLPTRILSKLKTSVQKELPVSLHGSSWTQLPWQKNPNSNCTPWQFPSKPWALPLQRDLQEKAFQWSAQKTKKKKKIQLVTHHFSFKNAFQKMKKKEASIIIINCTIDTRIRTELRRNHDKLFSIFSTKKILKLKKIRHFRAPWSSKDNASNSFSQLSRTFPVP